MDRLKCLGNAVVPMQGYSFFKAIAGVRRSCEMMDNMMYENFLKYLRYCGGCSGMRSVERCKFAVTCATVEALAKKGKIRSSMELRGYWKERTEHHG